MYIHRDITGPWRGLGQSDLGTSTTVLSYPGMPITPADENQMIGTPLTTSQLSSLSAANAAYFNQPTQGGFSAWLAANPGIVTLLEISGLLLAVISLAPRK